MRITHAELVKIAAHWLKKHWHCQIVATELVTTARETPDAIGWSIGGNHSILVECKTSAADFARDKFKGVKCDARAGLVKFYLTPPGLLDNPAEQLPPGWGLAETDGSNMVSIAHPAAKVTRNRRNEIAMLYSIILRQYGKSPATRKATIEINPDAQPTPPVEPPALTPPGVKPYPPDGEDDSD